MAQNDATHQDRHAGCTAARMSNAAALAAAQDPMQRELAIRNREAVPCVISAGQIAAWAVIASAAALGVVLATKGRGRGRGTGLSR
jgi:hypothetical protein